jgi:tRNA(fMet)-specific endonuclease VapC
LKYVLDTNFLIAVFRNQPRAIEVFTSLRRTNVSISVVTYLEFVRGEVAAGRTVSNRSRTLGVLNSLEQLPLTVAAALFAGREALRLKVGTPSGLNDLMIAATARELRRTVLTENVKDFTVVSGVKWKNWQLENP